MTFNALQVLRTANPKLRNAKGHPVKLGTRVVVVNVKDGVVTTRLESKIRVLGESKDFTTTKRGRPTKAQAEAKAKAAPKAAAAE